MYGFSVKLHGSFKEIVDCVTDDLKKEGFGILTTIDVQKTLKDKLGIEQRPYLILGACNPQLAHQALNQDPNIGLLLPCNVVVREENENNIIVSFMDPLIISNLANNSEITKIAQDVRQRLERVRKCLFGSKPSS